MKMETANLTRRELHDLACAGIPAPVIVISTIGQDGIYNAAPYSFVTPVVLKPLILCLSIGPQQGGVLQGQKKDTLRNIEFSHDFVVNIIDETIVERSIQTAATYPGEVDEFKEVGLTAITAEKVKSPRIAESKVSFECRLVMSLELLEEQRVGEGLRGIIFGEVVLAHIKDEVWVNGQLDPSRLRVISRVATDTYCKPGETFEIKVPKYLRE